jgi:hypothetical protein
MLNEEAFEVCCLQLHLSAQAKTHVQRIRSSPPSRLGAGNEKSALTSFLTLVCLQLFHPPLFCCVAGKEELDMVC